MKPQKLTILTLLLTTFTFNAFVLQRTEAGAFFSTGEMVAARSGQTATLLTNGLVLVAGGRDSSTFQETAGAELYDPATGTWKATGSMSIPRLNHTATLLPDGQVLVAGGTGTNFAAPYFGTLTNAELYNPATGEWSPTSPLKTARRSHTASLLPNGQVLVAGGAFDLSGSAELYDPATGQWTYTGTMTTNRQDHTATVLTNGMVLVAGGQVEVGFNLKPTATAELYDPNSGVWTATGSMTTNRVGHTATLLKTGQVLVEGDTTSSSIFDGNASAELYDPASGIWSVTGPMFFPSDQHLPATLLPDGEVLVAGGGGGVSGYNPAEIYNPDMGKWLIAGSTLGGSALSGNTVTLLANGQVLLAGGGLSGIYGAPSAQLYNPNTAWKATGSLNIPRLSGYTLTLLTNGDVLIAGGNGSSGVQASAELYHPTTGEWTRTGDMTEPREYHRATLLTNGQVLVTGGLDPDNPANEGVLTTTELYDPITGVWTNTGDMNMWREHHSATLLENGKVLVAGGGTTVHSAELYDPVAGTWSLTGSMNAARWHQAATLLPDGDVLVSGGIGSSGSQSSAELYDPDTGVWTNTPNMTAPSSYPQSVLLPDGKVFVANYYSTLGADVYDPATNGWTATASTTNLFSPGTATLLSDGRVLLAGAGGNNPTTTVSAEIYNPTNDTWVNTFGPMTSLRAQQQAVRLPDGRVLIAGGNSDYLGGDNGLTSELFDPSVGTGTMLSIILVPSPTFIVGAFQFNFTAQPGQQFTVWSTTDISIPFQNWTSLGQATETSSGNYEFSDAQAGGVSQRYYRVTSP